jgi:hypothetical protein
MICNLGEPVLQVNAKERFLPIFWRPRPGKRVGVATGAWWESGKQGQSELSLMTRGFAVACFLPQLAKGSLQGVGIGSLRFQTSAI